MEKPTIEVSKDGPYLVKNVINFKNSKGKEVKTESFMALCRCGRSNNKPFCDGTHAKVGFSGQKSTKRVLDKVEEFGGNEITINDNRGVCAHAAFCTNNLKEVFKLGEEPWIDAKGADKEKIIETIKKCPSGALSYSLDGVKYDSIEGEPRITITKDGPYKVTGNLELNAGEDIYPESKEHYTLCRCGGSKNKPFCDGSHWHVKFIDDKN